MTIQAKRDISRKLRVLTHGIKGGNISKTCRYFSISRETYYKWKGAYESEGEQMERIAERAFTLERLMLGRAS